MRRLERTSPTPSRTPTAAARVPSTPTRPASRTSLARRRRRQPGCARTTEAARLRRPATRQPHVPPYRRARRCSAAHPAALAPPGGARTAAIAKRAGSTARGVERLEQRQSGS
eukprot:scaffold3723_cov112-Isochrysis_galbana.AAC.8